VQATEIPKRLGRYEIIRELGKGAMGVVYEGRDPNIGRRVAIKTARLDVLQQENMAEEIMARFLREARAAGVLNHPNIVTVYDADEESDMAYIAMEFIEGVELRKLLQDKRRFSPEETVQLVSNLCMALDHAHSHGVVHRDVKPSNIMVLADGSIKVLDFGIAHVSGSNLTRDGSLIGTPYYMSPEQFMGHKVDGRSDLFAAGVIAYELLTGEKPFPGESVGTVMHNVLKKEPIPPRELNFAIPIALEKVVLKALQKDPNQRYQTGRSMASALAEAIRENPDPQILGFEIDHATFSDSEETVSMQPADEVKTLPILPSSRLNKDSSDGVKTISSVRHRLEKRTRKTATLAAIFLAGLTSLFFYFFQYSRPEKMTYPCWRSVEFQVLGHRFDDSGHEEVKPVSSPTSVEIFGEVKGQEMPITSAIVDDRNRIVEFPEGKWPTRFRYVARNPEFSSSAEGESVGTSSIFGEKYLMMPIHFYEEK